MRVFVTGATGALGRHLVPGLVGAGHEVTATMTTPGRVAHLPKLRGAGNMRVLSRPKGGPGPHRRVPRMSRDGRG
jgi:uncharacterized protein YbjT (DUF2867 family)